MLALLLAATCALPAFYAGLDIRPLNIQPFFVNEAASRAGYASDGLYEYIRTSEGLYRTTSITSQAADAFDRLLFGKVNDVVVHNGALYVLLEGDEVQGTHAVYHTLLRSTDFGRTFTPLDAGLEECLGGFCRFLPANQIDFGPNGQIFLSAGGNLLVTADNGATWTVLYGVTSSGRPALQSCPIVFTRFDRRVVIGGECPLDSGYVAVGDLRSDLLDWTVRPRRLTTPLEVPELENRNAQFVEKLPVETFVSVEGGLLKSCDNGTTFRYVIHYPLSGGSRYPYAHQFLAPSKSANVRIVGGFDKATQGPYLAWSADGGETWHDSTGLLPPDSTVALLTEGRDGLPMIFIQRGQTLTISRLLISELPLRRRGVRH